MEWDRKKRKFDWKRAIKMKGVHESMESEVVNVYICYFTNFL